MYFKPILSLFFIFISYGNVKSQMNNPVQIGSPRDIVYCLKLINQGKKIVFASGCDIQIISISDSSESMKLSVIHTGKVLSVDVYENSLKLVSGGMDSSIVVWDLKDGNVIKKIPVANNIITKIRIDPSGHKFAAGTNHGIIYVYNMDDFTLLKEIRAHQDEITDIEYNERDSCMVSSSGDRSIKFWDNKLFNQLAEIKKLKNWIRDLHYNSNFSRLLACGDGAWLYQWKITALDSISELSKKTYGFNWLMSTDISDNDKTIVVSGMDGIVRVITPFGIYKYKLRTPVTCVRFLPSDKYTFSVIVSTLGQGVRIINGKSMRFRSD
jgi:WD40 repeat protein